MTRNDKIVVLARKLLDERARITKKHHKDGSHTIGIIGTYDRPVLNKRRALLERFKDPAWFTPARDKPDMMIAMEMARIIRNGRLL